jgi:hypothetical protein
MTREPVPRVFANRREVAIVIFVALASLFFLIYVGGNLPGNVAETWKLTIFTDTRQQVELTCPPEKRLIVTGKVGPAEIEWDDRGRVRIVASTCPCKTCVNMGWTSDAAIVCVPNGIVIEPVRQKSAAVDAVTR